MTNGGGLHKDDWVTQLLDKLDEVIEFVRSKTTEPQAKAARYVVYLSLFSVVGVALLTLGLILLVRIVAYIPDPIWTGNMGHAVAAWAAGMH